VVRLSCAEPERFGAIFDAYFVEIHGYVARRLGNDAAEDVVAETFLAAFRKRGHYDATRGSVRTWLYGITTKLVGKHRRSEIRALRAHLRYGPERIVEGHEDRVAAQVSAEGLHAGLARSIARLNQGDRDVLLLVALAGLRHDEVAAALEIPYGTVGSRLNRARRRLREALGGTNPMNDLEEREHG
jgi:RNA polymerase sigma-70 factor (ECF subfamily)